MTQRQTNMAAALTGLSPLLYIVPGAQVRALGGAGWIGCLAALPALAALGVLLHRRPPRAPGRLLSAMLGLWLAAAAASVLHGCAARFCTAAGVFRSPVPYAALLLMTAVPAALSRKKALFRASEIFLPVVLALLGVGLLCAAKQLRPVRLADLTQLQPLGVAEAAASVLAVGTAALLLPRIFAGANPTAAPAVALGAVAAVVCAAAVSVLGAPMAARLELPVFTMLRSVGLLHTVERLDALIAAVWVLPDVTVLALLLRAGGDCAAKALHIPQPQAPTLAAAVTAAAGAGLIGAQGPGFPARVGAALAAGVGVIAAVVLARKRA